MACLPAFDSICVPPETLVYQAASPDEEALVGAARELGWVFLSRTRDFVTVSELGVAHQYQLLALLDFTSQRRRMSVLGESIRLYAYPSINEQIYSYFIHQNLFCVSNVCASVVIFLNKPASLVVFFF